MRRIVFLLEERAMKLVPEFQKVSGARRMASRLSRERNRARSFQVFIEGIEREVIAMQSASDDGEEI